MTDPKAPIDHVLEMSGRLGELTGSLDAVKSQLNENKSSNDSLRQSLEILNLRMASMPDDEHRKHHDFINLVMEEHKQSMAIKADIKQKLAAGSVWAVICAIATLAWYGFKTKIGSGP